MVLLWMLLLTAVAFLFFRTIMVLIGKVFEKKSEKKQSEFILRTSTLMQMVFAVLWMVNMEIADQRYGLNDLMFYVSFCMIGISFIVWCYFSWDLEQYFVMPRKATADEKRQKRIIVYLLLLVFVLCQGYVQAMKEMGKQIDETQRIIFSVTNYSVIVAGIALDRLMNQIFRD